MMEGSAKEEASRPLQSPRHMSMFSRRHPTLGEQAILPTPGSCPDDGAVTVIINPVDESLQQEIWKDIDSVPCGGADDERSPWICRVHPSIREKQGDAYEPKLVSIGPLHHGEPSLQPMEATKKRYVRTLLDRSQDKSSTLVGYIEAIREIEDSARKEYPEHEIRGRFDSVAFVKMLLVEGCFIIEYMLRAFLREKQEGVWGNSYNLERDLMLLENQIPFYVLQRLFDQTCATARPPAPPCAPPVNYKSQWSSSSSSTSMGASSLPSPSWRPSSSPPRPSSPKPCQVRKQFWWSQRPPPPPPLPPPLPSPQRLLPSPPPSLVQIALHFLDVKADHSKIMGYNSAYHLLHLSHMCWQLRDVPLTATSRYSWARHAVVAVLSYPIRAAFRLIKQAVICLLFVLLINEWPWSRHKPDLLKKIPCAADLDMSGVKFRRKLLRRSRSMRLFETESSTTASCDTSFRRREGVLEIPFVRVGQTLNARLRNFIALEQCQQFHLPFHYSAYVSFMNSIIYTPADVALLRKYGVIEISFGSDEDVAKMFKSIYEDTNLYKVRIDDISQLSKELNAYCDVAYHRWQGRLWSSYLRSPWSTIALVAGSIMLGLTATQTIFTIRQLYK